MSKVKLNVKKVVKGMYVTELDRPWNETPFLFQGFRITNEHEVEQLQKICKYVFIDNEKSTVKISADLIALSNEKQNIEVSKTEPLFNIDVKHKSHNENFEDEFPKAKTVYKDVTEQMDAVFNELRMGKALNVKAVKSSVKTIMDSVLRNPDALKLMCVLQERDKSAITHALHVCILTLSFAYYLGLKNDVMQQLGVGALLHDIGETKLPSGLFWKSEPFSEEEKKQVYKHTEFGADIIKNTEGFDPVVLDIVQDHHERLNRTGFPRQAGGNEISYNAMLVSIVDVYDSVTMGYEGRVPVSCTEALKSMYYWRNDLFQGELVEHFIQCLGIYPIGSVVKLNSDEVGIVVTFDDFSRLAPRIMLLIDKDKKFYSVPKILDLSKFREHDDSYKYEIKQVVNPDDYDIDIRHYILQELYSGRVVNE